MPLLIKQIINSGDQGVKLSGLSFGMMTVVAIVRAIEHSSTKITFTLEDHTGQIDAHLWLEEGDVAQVPAILLNTYACVHGSVRTQGGTKAIMIFRIDAINSINELTTHILEVLNARYMAEEFAKNDGIETGHNNAHGDFIGNAPIESNSAHSGLKGKHLLVFEAVKNHKSEQGISIQELQSKFSHISESELQ